MRLGHDTLLFLSGLDILALSLLQMDFIISFISPEILATWEFFSQKTQNRHYKIGCFFFGDLSEFIYINLDILAESHI